jgi:hypothetical protein
MGLILRQHIDWMKTKRLSTIDRLLLPMNDSYRSYSVEQTKLFAFLSSLVFIFFVFFSFIVLVPLEIDVSDLSMTLLRLCERRSSLVHTVVYRCLISFQMATGGGGGDDSEWQKLPCDEKVQHKVRIQFVFEMFAYHHCTISRLGKLASRVTKNVSNSFGHRIQTKVQNLANILDWSRNSLWIRMRMLERKRWMLSLPLSKKHMSLASESATVQPIGTMCPCVCVIH